MQSTNRHPDVLNASQTLNVKSYYEKSMQIEIRQSSASTLFKAILKKAPLTTFLGLPDCMGYGFVKKFV
jgi:hypothetical protein